jgi:hypothetical protein
MSVELWTAAIPPPACTKRMTASRCGWVRSGPGRLPPAHDHDAFRKRIAS